MLNMSLHNSGSIKFAFFGSSRLSVIVLDELKKLGFIPSLVITTPDKPQGRKLVLTSNIVKLWAIENSISVLDPTKLDGTFVDLLKKSTSSSDFATSRDSSGIQLFIVASFGKIIPEAVLSIPPKGTLNIHPSLLPRYRGPSPLPSAMLDDVKKTGVTIMKVDGEMDHGPIVAQKQITITEWPIYEKFEEMMAIEGAKLLADTIPKWMSGMITEKPQDHAAATYTKKVAKEDGLIYINDPKADQYLNFRKIQAYHEWPQAYFIADRRGQKIRVKITQASFTTGKLQIEKVIPEGGKEMNYEDFLRGLK